MTKTPSALPNVRFRKGAWRLQTLVGKRPDGTPQFLYDTVYEPDTERGRAKAQLAALALKQRAVEMRLQAVEEEAQATVDAEKPTVGYVLDLYVEWGQSPNRRRRGKRGPMSPNSLNTLRSNVSVLKSFVVNDHEDTLGDMEVKDLTNKMLGSYYEVMLDLLDLEESTVARYHGALCAAFERARREGIINHNPAMDVADKPSQMGKPIILPADEDMDQLLVRASGDYTMQVWLMLAFSFGARRGTLGALRWRHLDLGRARITFEDALSDGGKAHGGVKVKRGLKAGNEFMATLNSLEVEHLTELRDRQRRAIGPIWNEDFFVFSRTGGTTFMHPSTVSHEFARLRDAAGLKVTLHQFKHYCVTTLLRDGIPIDEVAARTGTTTDTLLRRYSKFVSGADQRSAATMERRLGGVVGRVGQPAGGNVVALRR